MQVEDKLGNKIIGFLEYIGELVGMSGLGVCVGALRAHQTLEVLAET